VKANLAAAGFDETQLLCGTHPPVYFQTQYRLPRSEDIFTPVQNNCSGKHSGFLALTRYLQDDPKNYLDPGCRTQQLVLKAISQIYDYPEAEIVVGVDGCSAPAFGMPLRHTAIAYMKLANPTSALPESRQALIRIRQAMWAHPEMVSGPGRFDLALASTFPNNVINKVGAEAIEGVGFVNPPIGIAIKILDGNDRALFPVVIEVLRQLGLLPGVDISRWQPFVSPTIYNHHSLRTGEIRAEFELKSV
jgi:L-asparaginase II